MNFTPYHGAKLLPKPKDWWQLPKAMPGHINGLEKVFSGLAVATNGPLVAIETSKGQVVIGHKDWFVEDKVQNEKATKKSGKYSMLDQFFKL